jgi:hypothetical protein
MRRIMLAAAISFFATISLVHAQRSPGDYKTFMSYYWDNCATPTPSGKVPFNCAAPAR